MRHGTTRRAMLAAAPPPGRAAAPGAAPAQEGGFTKAQRAEILGILRDALRSDPSILREALEGLEAADRREREGASRAAIAAHAEALFRNPADPAIGNPAGRRHGGGVLRPALRLLQADAAGDGRAAAPPAATCAGC